MHEYFEIIFNLRHTDLITPYRILALIEAAVFRRHILKTFARNFTYIRLRGMPGLS